MDTDASSSSNDFAASIGIDHAMRTLDDHAHPPPATTPPDPPTAATSPAADATTPPAAPTAPAEPPAPDDGSIDAIRSRLAARGLLVQGPAIVVPKEPRPEKPVVLDDVLAEAEGELHPNAVAEDDWDVATEGGQLHPVRCPQCRGTQLTPVDVTRFRCVSCERAWRWAVCEECDDLAFTVERQESWRCSCGHYTRSWWRTDTAPREALNVVARRKDLVAQAERAEVRAGMRRRRWKIVLGAVVGLLAVLVFVLTVRAGEATPEEGTAATCRHFETLRTGLGNGTLDGQELSATLDELSAAAGTAETAVHDAAIELAAVRSPSKAAFLIAQTRLADACAAFDARN